MRKLFLILLLILPALARATEYYVDASRPDDTGNGLSPATAEKTVQAGVTDAGTNGDIVHVAAGTYTETANSGSVVIAKGISIIGAGSNDTFIQGAGGSGGILYSENGTGTCAITGCTLTATTGIGFGTIYLSGSKNFTFTDVYIADSVGGDDQAVLMLGHTGTATFTNCTIGRGDQRSVYADRTGGIAVTGGIILGKVAVDASNNSGAISFTNVAISPNNLFLALTGAVTFGNITFTGCTITTHTTFNFLSIATDSTIGDFTATNNIVTAQNEAGQLFYAKQKCGAVTISGNRITLSGVDEYDTILGVGMQPGDSPGTITGPVSISNNTITSPIRAVGAHGIYLGKGVTSSRVTGNQFTNLTYGVVCKNTANAQVARNTLSGTISILVKDGSTNCAISGNTSTASPQEDFESAAMFLGGGGGGVGGLGVQSTGIVIVGNTFTALPGCDYVFYDYEGTNNPGDMPGSKDFIDDNVYRNQTGDPAKLAYINATACSTIQGMQDAWAGYGGTVSRNDANSSISTQGGSNIKGRLRRVAEAPFSGLEFFAPFGSRLQLRTGTVNPM